MKPATDFFPARLAILGHLERVELNLIDSSLPRTERDEVLASIAAQFADQLGKPYADATADDTNRALAQLPTPDTYRSNDEPTLMDLLRQLFRRMTRRTNGIPVAIIDTNGERKILWGALIPRLLALAAFMAATFFLMVLLLMPHRPALDLHNTCFGGFLIACMIFGMIRQIKKTPVDQLPRADEIQPIPFGETALQTVAAMIFGTAMTAAVFSVTYLVAGFITGRPPWPFSPDLFLLSVSITWPLMMLWFFVEGRRQKRSLFRLRQLV